MLRAPAFALSLFGVLSAPAFAAGLTASQTVELATIQVEADGLETVTYSPATDVEPGEQVRYSLVYANEGADAAENVSLVMPVPDEVTYLEGTVDSVLSTVTFSADGGETFAPRESVQVADGTRLRLANAEEITHIKWAFEGPLAPDASGRVSFEAVLK